jgi:hypothetical protein
MAGRKIGRVQKLYLNSAAYASPTWVEFTKVGDVDITMEKATSEINTRETPNTKTIGGNNKIGLTFDYFRVDALTDAVFTALRASYLNNTPMDLAGMESAIASSGAKGIRGPFLCTKCTRKEPVNEATRYEVELMETDDYSSDGATAYFAQDFTSP